MRGLKLVVFTLSFLALSSQLMRHIYVQWIVQRQSVLNKYARPVEAAVREATSIEELERRYADELERARKEAAEEKVQGPQERGRRPAEGDPEVMRLAQAIREWESKENQIRALYYFWTCGLLVLLFAAFCHWRRWDWIGLALQILAFSEMIYWTSPSFFQGAEHEFTRLVYYKLAFTTLSLLLLLVSWRLGLLRPGSPSDVKATSYETAGQGGPRVVVRS